MGFSLIEGFTKSLAMTVLSEIGDKTFFAAAIPRKWTHHITTTLFFGFGLWSLWDGFKEQGEAEELAEVEAQLNADLKADTNGAKGTSKGNDLKKQQRPFLTQFFSPILLKAFSITFFDRYNWTGIRREPVRCGSWLNPRTNIVLHNSGCGRKELSIPNIREDGSTL